MTRISATMTDVEYAGRKVTTITATYRCDLCLRPTDEFRMRLRPRKPIPATGPIEHECSQCVRALGASTPPSAPSLTAPCATSSALPGLWETDGK